MATRKRTAARSKAAAVRENALAPFETRRLLLDTYAWIWWMADAPELGDRARRAIATASEVWISAASVWEMSMKVALGRLAIPPDVDLEASIVDAGFRALAIDVPHAIAAAALSHHHRRHWVDHMLVAQAQVEGLTLVAADPSLARHGGRILSARE